MTSLPDGRRPARRSGPALLRWLALLMAANSAVAAGGSGPHAKLRNADPGLRNDRATLATSPQSALPAPPSQSSVLRPPSPAVRTTTLLDSGWRTQAFATGSAASAAVLTPAFDDSAWPRVTVPHNWDGYEGFRQVRHGDRHGTAWYRRTFSVAAAESARRVFLHFEGVGSYATVWVNGREVGSHAGGLTTFTLDVTDVVRFGADDNLLVVRADHPAGIRDLPWVCGGCERAYGFSEGTQPFGIFRPVHVVTTAPIRVEPFGVHVWNDTDVTSASARVHVRTDIRNYGSQASTIKVVSRILAPPGERDAAASPLRHPHSAFRDPRVVSATESTVVLAPGAVTTIPHEPPAIEPPRLWSPDSPQLYGLETEIHAADGSLLDHVTTSFGIRTIRWPAPDETDARFLVNGQPVFLNGICDYEHNLGASHAFTSEQIHARVRQMQAAGFNAFRDAHHPHNLRFHPYWDESGMLWWTQFGAHAWFDNAVFRTNFKTLLREWVKERRNSPSLVLWGIQNESMLPTEFAAECSAIIRELDPTASAQRRITTCNGGTGTDWDVPQNWSGTYSGNLDDYANDLRRQKLVGEYGAWRSLGLHTEGGFRPQAPYSEDRMAALMETKVRLAETVRDEVAGHFMWLFTTHSNPGRNVGELGEQLADGTRPLDHISPANNKGLLTLWGEPLDVYYMYRANYAPADEDPMVYIASHTWPDRWTTPGRKDGIVVYSNCEEVELFNDLGARSLGRRQRGPRGTHFQWDGVEIAANVLYAEGRIRGKVVARDLITLHHLPEPRRFAAAQRAEPDVVAPRPGRDYLYRVNCGGPDYTDSHGTTWLADRDLSSGPAGGAAREWGSSSWTHAYPYLHPRFGSQRRIHDPILDARDDALFQTFRYGRDQLRYVFPVPDGEYEVELYFIEPWYGANAGALARSRDVGGVPPPRGIADAPRLRGEVTPAAANASHRWRLFDVALNGETVLRDLDLVAEAGDRARVVKKIVSTRSRAGRVELSFPRVAAGQAVISAIAISRATGGSAVPAPHSPRLVDSLETAAAAGKPSLALRHALDTGDRTYSDADGAFSQLPPELLEADWIQTASAARNAASAELARFRVTADATVFVAHAAPPDTRPAWLANWEHTAATLATNAAPGQSFALYRQPFTAGSIVTLGTNRSSDVATDLPMYCVFVVPTRPAAPPQLIRELYLDGLEVGRDRWARRDVRSGNEQADISLPPLPVRLTGNLRTGREIYTDAAVRISSLPGNLTDCDLLALPQAGAPAVGFSASDDVEVYVAVDPRITDRPAWLAEWAPVRETIATTHRDAAKFALLRRRYKPGQRVELGANGRLPSGETAAMYFVVVRAVRASVFLEAEAAALNRAEVAPHEGASGGSAVKLPGGNAASAEWTVAVGVGDRYGISVRFAAAEPTPPIAGELTIIGADGRVLRTDKLEFPAVASAHRWTYLRTRTGASINAGTYRFRITHQGTQPLVIDSLEVE